MTAHVGWQRLATVALGAILTLPPCRLAQGQTEGTTPAPRLLKQKEGFLSIAFSPDGKLLASGGANVARLWDVSTGKNLAALKPATIFSPRLGYVNPVTSVAFSPAGKLLATGSDTLQLWEVATRKNFGMFPDARNAITLAFSPDGRFLASGHNDLQVRLWDVKRRTLTARFQNDAGFGKIGGIAFSPDGKALVAVGSRKGAKWWDVATGKNTDTVPDRRIAPSTCALSPDGKLLAVAGDGSVMLWDVGGRKVTAMLQHSAQDRHNVVSVAFSPDGKVLASGGDDGDVKVWDAASGKLLTSFPGRRGVQVRVAFSPDGKYLAAGDDWGTLRLWPQSARDTSSTPGTPPGRARDPQRR
jgi:WD40 repeat protein